MLPTAKDDPCANGMKTTVYSMNMNVNEHSFRIICSVKLENCITVKTGSESKENRVEKQGRKEERSHGPGSVARVSVAETHLDKPSVAY